MFSTVEVTLWFIFAKKNYSFISHLKNINIHLFIVYLIMSHIMSKQNFYFENFVHKVELQVLVMEHFWKPKQKLHILQKNIFFLEETERCWVERFFLSGLNYYFIFECKYFLYIQYIFHYLNVLFSEMKS